MRKRIRTMKSLAMTAILSLASAIVPLYAQTVEVALVETAFDGLFDSGLIGTNSRPVLGDRESFLGYAPGSASVEGLIDYVIVVLAEYGQGTPVPECSYRLVRVRDGKELARGRVPVAVPATTSGPEIDKACSALGSAISAACGGVLRGVSASRRKYGYEEA
jgi:hypothetical protein